MAIGDVEAAISGGDVEAVRRWLETGGDVNAKGDSAGNWSLLYEACCNSVGESLVGITGREYWETRQKNNEARVAIITASATRAATVGGAADRGRGSTHPGRAPERYAQPGDATLRPARAFGVERPRLLGLGARPGLLS